MPPQNIRRVPGFKNMLKRGVCNVIGDDGTSLLEAVAEASGELGDNVLIGTNVFTQEPIAMVTLSDGPKWTSFVEAVLQGLLEAEARNITQATASSFPLVPYFGPPCEMMISRAVDGIGNFGQVYERTVGAKLPREGLNQLRTDRCENQLKHPGGLVYGIPFGRPIKEDPRTEKTGKLANVLEQGLLKCGVSTNVTTSEFNIAICEAIATALFGEVSNRTEIVSLPMEFNNSFGSLLDDEIDIVVGALSSNFPPMEGSLKDFSFSRPYLFSPLHDDRLDASLLVTKSEDHRYSSFVQWVIDAIVNAETNLFSKEEKDKADFLNATVDVSPLYGKWYGRIFKDIISTVGNYEEIFERTMNVARSGCNLPNTAAPHGPQHFPFLFHGL